MVADKSSMGNKQDRGRETQREQIKGVRDRETERIRNGMGWK